MSSLEQIATDTEASREVLYLVPQEYESLVIRQLAGEGRTPRFLPYEGRPNRLYFICIKQIRLVEKFLAERYPEFEQVRIPNAELLLEADFDSRRVFVTFFEDEHDTVLAIVKKVRKPVKLLKLPAMVEILSLMHKRSKSRVNLVFFKRPSAF